MWVCALVNRFGWHLRVICRHTRTPRPCCLCRQRPHRRCLGNNSMSAGSAPTFILYSRLCRPRKKRIFLLRPCLHPCPSLARCPVVYLHLHLHPPRPRNKYPPKYERRPLCWRPQPLAYRAWLHPQGRHWRHQCVDLRRIRSFHRAGVQRWLSPSGVDQASQCDAQCWQQRIERPARAALTAGKTP